jgi:hypothetical protein
LNISIDGQIADIFDDAALRRIIEERTERVISPLLTADAPNRERALFNTLTWLAVRTGALASFHYARPNEPFELNHLIELAGALHDCVGMKLVLPELPEAEPKAGQPQIIMPAKAANEGDDLE